MEDKLRNLDGPELQSRHGKRHGKRQVYKCTHENVRDANVLLAIIENMSAPKAVRIVSCATCLSEPSTACISCNVGNVRGSETADLPTQLSTRYQLRADCAIALAWSTVRLLPVSGGFLALPITSDDSSCDDEED